MVNTLSTTILFLQQVSIVFTVFTTLHVRQLLILNKFDHEKDLFVERLYGIKLPHRN